MGLLLESLLISKHCISVDVTIVEKLVELIKVSWLSQGIEISGLGLFGFDLR